MASLAEAATTNRFFARPRCKPDREQQGADMGKNPSTDLRFTEKTEMTG